MHGYSATRDAQGILTIHRVPIFVECSRDEHQFDASWISQAVNRANRAAAEGYFPPLHIRHHEAGQEVRPAGYFKIVGTSPIQFKGAMRVAVLADLVVTDPAVQDEVLAKRLPYRSVEIFDADEPNLDSLALLDHEAPYLELPMLMVSQVDQSARGEPALAFQRLSKRGRGVDQVLCDASQRVHFAEEANSLENAAKQARSKLNDAVSGMRQRGQQVAAMHEALEQFRIIQGNELHQNASLISDDQRRHYSVIADNVLYADRAEQSLKRAYDGWQRSKGTPAESRRRADLQKAQTYYRETVDRAVEGIEAHQRVINETDPQQRADAAQDALTQHRLDKAKGRLDNAEKDLAEAQDDLALAQTDLEVAQQDESATPEEISKLKERVQHAESVVEASQENRDYESEQHQIEVRKAVKISDERKSRPAPSGGTDKPKGKSESKKDEPKEGKSKDSEPKKQGPGVRHGEDGRFMPGNMQRSIKMSDSEEAKKEDDEDAVYMEDGAEGGSMVDVASIVSMIEDGSITVADMDAIVAAVEARKAATAEAPAEPEAEPEMEMAPAQAPGEAMQSVAMARALGEVAALKAKLEQREREDTRREDVAKAMKDLAGKPLGADLESRLVNFHKKHGGQAFRAHVEAMVQTFASFRKDERAAFFAAEPAPEIANRYLKDGIQAVDRAAKFAREHQELVRGGHTRMSLDRYVELNMARK